MDKLIDYICDELDDLEKKAEKNGKLSQTEIQYGDMLAHFKKNLLTADAMMDTEYDGISHARGRGRYARRDAMGRYSTRYEDMSRDNMSGRGSYDDMSYRRSYDGYSRGKDHLLKELKDMEHDADDESKRMIHTWIKQLEER